MKPAFCLFLLALPGWATTTVTVHGPTASTQAVLDIRTTQTPPCNVLVSEGVSYAAPGVNDLNATLFTGSNSTSRAEAITAGGFIQFPVGERTSVRASDGNFYSRALQANTQHAFSVTCSPDAAVTGNFTTANIPLGDTSPQSMNAVFDVTGPNNFSWPTINWNNPTQTYVDPFTGAILIKITSPGLADNINSTRKNALATWVGQPASDWTGLSAFNTGTGTATYTGAGGSSHYVVMPIRNSGMSTLHNTGISGNNQAVVDVLLRLNGFGSPMDACIANTDGTTCLSNPVTLTIPASAAAEVQGPGSLTTGNWNANPVFALWSWVSGALPPNSPSLSDATGTLNGTGSSAIVTRASGALFDPWIKPNTPIKITGSGCSYLGVTDLCQIASVTNTNTINLTAPITPALSGAAFDIQPIMVKLWPTGNETISYFKYDLAQNNNYNTGDEGDGSNMHPIAVTTPVSASGSTLPAPLTGYMTAFPDDWSNNHLYFFIPSTGEARTIAHLVPPASPGNTFWDGSAWTGSSDSKDSSQYDFNACSPFVTWVYDDAYSGYCARRTDGNPGLYYTLWKFTYNYSTTANSSGQICDFRSFTTPWSDNAPGADSTCLEWRNLTPASLSRDLTSQVQAAYPSINTNYFTQWVFRGGPGRYLAAALNVSTQDSLSYGFTIDTKASPTPFTITGKTDTWSTWPARIAVEHGGGMVYNSYNYGATYLAGTNNGGGGLNFTAAVSAIVNPSQAGTAITATTGTTCPGGIDPRWTPPAGAMCIEMTLATDPVHTSPSNGELDSFPWAHNGLIATCPHGPGDGTTSFCYTNLSPMAAGDDFVDNAQLGQNGEHMTFILPVSTSGTSVTGWFWRQSTILNSAGIGCSIHDSSTQATAHSSGFSLTAFPPKNCNGNDVWYAASDTTGSNGIADNPGLRTSHQATSIDAANDAMNFAIAASGILSTGESYRSGGALPGWIGGPQTSSFGFIPQFAGSSAATTEVQSHPNAAQFAANATDKQWLVDGNPFGPSFGGNGPSNLYTPTITATSVTNVYDVSPQGGTLLSQTDYKRIAIVVTPGAQNVQEISGPGSSITATSYWTFCYAYVAGDCISGSTRGHTYVNIPGMETTGACFVNQYDIRTPCVIYTTGRSSNISQQQFNIPDPEFLGLRNLGMAFNGPARTDDFWNAHTDPTASWTAVTLTWGDDLLTEIFAYKLPPWRKDSVNRGTFANIPVQLPAGADARIRFGYSPLLYCQQYASACATDGTGATPYLFLSETQQFTSCASGCTINIPALPNRVLYYAIDRTTGNGPVQMMVAP